MFCNNICVERARIHLHKERRRREKREKYSHTEDTLYCTHIELSSGLSIKRENEEKKRKETATLYKFFCKIHQSFFC